MSNAVLGAHGEYYHWYLRTKGDQIMVPRNIYVCTFSQNSSRSKGNQACLVGEYVIYLWDIPDMGANLIFFLWYGAKKSRVIDTDFDTLIWGHFRIYMFDMGSCFRPFIWYGVLFLPVPLIWGQKSHFIRYGVEWVFFVFRWYGVGIILSFDIGSFLLMEVI
jgi:hypothetical protein